MTPIAPGGQHKKLCQLAVLYKMIFSWRRGAHDLDCPIGWNLSMVVHWGKKNIHFDGRSRVLGALEMGRKMFVSDQFETESCKSLG